VGSVFADTITVADVYHYGTEHYGFHRPLALRSDPLELRGCSRGLHSHMFVGYRVGATCSAYRTVVLEAPMFSERTSVGSLCTHDLLPQQRSMASRAS